MDSFYTPPILAQRLVNQSSLCRTPRFVADFAVGRGALLRAAADRWPNAIFVGVDIRRSAVKSLAQEQKSWRLTQCNFMDAAERARHRRLRHLYGVTDLVLLNPPFSAIGSETYEIDLFGVKGNCSLGLAFVANSLPFLANDGELLAILPAGTLDREMDANVWDAIDNFFRWSLISRYDDKTFDECYAKTIVIRLTRKRGPSRRITIIGARSSIEADQFNVQRGKVNMPTLSPPISKRGVPLIHTTELRNNVVDVDARRVDRSRAHLKGPAVLLPRVGRPRIDKICVHNGKPIALSNCVISITCRSVTEAVEMRKALQKNWSKLIKSYTGTCAQYITLKRVEKLLALACVKSKLRKL